MASGEALKNSFAVDFKIKLHISPKSDINSNVVILLLGFQLEIEKRCYPYF